MSFLFLVLLILGGGAAEGGAAVAAAAAAGGEEAGRRPPRLAARERGAVDGASAGVAPPSAPLLPSRPTRLSTSQAVAGGWW